MVVYCVDIYWSGIGYRIDGWFCVIKSVVDSCKCGNRICEINCNIVVVSIVGYIGNIYGDRAGDHISLGGDSRSLPVLAVGYRFDGLAGIHGNWCGVENTFCFAGIAIIGSIADACAQGGAGKYH